MQNLILQNVTVDELTERIIKRLEDRIPEKKQQAQIEYITRRQLSKLLSIDIATVHRWTKEGKLPSYRLGGRVYFKRTDIEASLQPVPNLKEGRKT